MSEIVSLFKKHQSYKYQLRRSTAKERLKKFSHLKNLILERQSAICVAMKEDFNKPEAEVNLTEIMPVISHLNLLKKELVNWMQPKVVSGGVLFQGTKAWVQPESKGSCLIISPWNYPFQLSMIPVITSYSAGNTTIIKPSEFTPATNKIIGEIIGEVFTRDEVAMVEGAVEESTELLALPFDHIFFTGSTPVGKVVMAAAAKNLASVSLELGGKSPVVIDREVDLNEVMPKLLWGKLVNGGQTCVAPDYVLLPEEKLGEFSEMAKGIISEMYPEGVESFDQAKDYNFIITTRHADRLKKLISESLTQGAVDILGFSATGERVVPPTILTGATKEMPIMQEEIFGPVLPVVTYRSVDEAIEFINSYDHALAMYLFSHNKQFIDRLSLETTNGGVTINEVMMAVGHPNLPFGGIGPSGLGKYHGHYGFDEFSHHRPYFKRTFDTKLDYFYPPYTPKKNKLVQSLLQKFSGFF